MLAELLPGSVGEKVLAGPGRLWVLPTALARGRADARLPVVSRGRAGVVVRWGALTGPAGEQTCQRSLQRAGARREATELLPPRGGGGRDHRETGGCQVGFTCGQG